MKKLSKVLVLVLSAIMVLAMSASVFAASGQVGETGSITVKNATKGHDYKAYKIFDASFNDDAVSYKVEAAKKEFVNTDYFTVSSVAETIGGKQYYTVSPKVDAEGNNVKSDEEIIAWIKDNYSKFDATGVAGTWDAENSTVTFGNLPYGYYYITSSLGTAVTINSAKPTQDVYDKNEVSPTDPVKKIVSVDGTAVENLDQADAHVGSVVGFKVTAKTTNWTGKESAATITEAWSMEDTPTNMTIDANSVDVKFNGTSLAKTAYSVSVGADGKLSINVPMVDENGNSIYPAPKTEDAENGLIPIEVTYSATITAAAAGAPATNEVGDSKVEVDTYAFQVAKTDGTDPLPGAQFELWSAKGTDGEAAALTFIDNGDGTYTYSADGTVTTLDMTTNTTIVVKGLDNSWTYTLKETKVPAGYNQAADITVAGSSLTKVTKDTDTTTASTALYKETVVNKQGAVLPSTGGIGTTIFYILGTLLVVGCGIVLVSRKRMEKNN